MLETALLRTGIPPGSTGELSHPGGSDLYWPIYLFYLNEQSLTNISRGMGLWPLLPGFIREIRGTSNHSGWDHLYEISYFAGFVISFVVYLVLNALFPIRGRKGSSPFLHKGVGVLVTSDDESLGLEEGSKDGEPRLSCGELRMGENVPKSC